MADAPPARRPLRVSGRHALLALAILAAAFAIALYWSLAPLYKSGKQGLRTSPPAESTTPQEPAPAEQP